ncbi:MAG: sulfotransferase [Gammaproteobacteria bacterium]|jgi:hypothetical protein|nr:sulfotransferase [Gammaproteobacteria bacterium]
MVAPAAVFVVGNSRSGTTMMGRILGRHPAIRMFRELHFYEELWAPDAAAVWSDAQAVTLAATLLSIERDGYMAQRKTDAWRAAAERLVAGLPPGQRDPEQVYCAFLAGELERSGKSIACEQTPRNVFYLRQIRDLFPEVLVVEMVRDPRDVLVSKKNKWKRLYLGDSKRPLRAAVLSWANYHPLLTARLWVAAVRAGGAAAGEPRHVRIRFEDFVAAPEPVLRNLCAQLGVPFEPDMLQVEHAGSSVEADSSAVGVRADAAGRWRRGGLNPTEIATCQQIAGREMAALGYELVPARRNPLRVIGYYLSAPLKLLVALVMNLGRLRSLSAAIKRRLR